MFFKNKHKSSAFFSLPNQQRRHAFRVRPATAAPIEFAVRGQAVRVWDISAGGLSFSGPPCSAGDRENIVFALPGLGTSITATIEVVKVGADGLVHCRFIDMATEIQDDIHLYVLRRQKQMILSADQSEGPS